MESYYPNTVSWIFKKPGRYLLLLLAGINFFNVIASGYFSDWNFSLYHMAGLLFSFVLLELAIEPILHPVFLLLAIGGSIQYLRIGFS